RDAIRELTARYVGQFEAEIHALMHQYQQFIGSMSAVVETLRGGATPAALLDQLSRIVESGKPLVSPARGRRTAGRSRARSAAREVTRSEPLRILCVHGVGHEEEDRDFEKVWRDSITYGLAEWTLSRPFEIQFVQYDDLFEAD